MHIRKNIPVYQSVIFIEIPAQRETTDFSNELFQSQFKEKYEVNANTDTHGYGTS